MWNGDGVDAKYASMVETGGFGKGGGVDLEVGNWFPLDFDAGMRFVYVVCVCVRAYVVL